MGPMPPPGVERAVPPPVKAGVSGFSCFFLFSRCFSRCFLVFQYFLGVFHYFLVCISSVFLVFSRFQTLSRLVFSTVLKDLFSKA